MNKPIDLKRDALGHYRAGNPPGPGRPRGSKNRLGQQFMKDLQSMWGIHGPEILMRAALTQPASFMRSMVIMLKPTVRDMDLPETTDFRDLETPAEVIEAARLEFGDEVASALAKSMGIKIMKVIEAGGADGPLSGPNGPVAEREAGAAHAAGASNVRRSKDDEGQPEQRVAIVQQSEQPQKARPRRRRRKRE